MVESSTNTKDGQLQGWGRALLALHLTLTAVLFWPGTLEAFEYPKSMLLRTVAILLLAAALAGAGRRPSLAWLRRDPIAWGLLLLLVSGVVSTWRSLSPRTSVFGAQESFGGLLTLAAYVVLFFATRALCRQADDYRVLFGTCALGALGASAYGGVQFLKLDPLQWIRTHQFLGVWRVFGTLGNPTFLGGWLAATLPLVAYLALRAWRRRERRAAALWAAVLAADVLVLLVTLARGAWLAAALGMLVFAAGLWLGAGSAAARRKLLLTGGALTVLAVLGLAAVPPARAVFAAMLRRVVLTVETRPQARPEGGLSFKQEPRLAIWTSAWAMFKHHPLTGVGLDAFQLGYQQERSLEVWETEGNRTPQRAHNELLNALATQGLLGAAALALVTLGLASCARAALRRHPQETAMVVVAIAALSALYLHVAFNLLITPLGALFVTLAALLSRLGQAESVEPSGHVASTPRARVALYGLAAAAGAAALFLLVVQPLRADLLAQRGALQDAQRRGASLVGLSQAVRLDPGRDLLWSRFGVAQFQAGEQQPSQAERGAWFQQAREAFEQARALVPANSYHHLNVARALAQLSLLDPPLAGRNAAYESLERALKLDPRNPYLYAEAGRTALGFGDRPRVRAWARQCHDMAPTYGPCAWLLANLELEQALGDTRPLAARRPLFAAAGDALRTAASAQWYGDNAGQAVAASQAAAALIAAQRVQDGLRLAQLATQMDAQNPDARYNLAKAFEYSGQTDKAEWEYRQALRIDAQHAEARAALDALVARRPAAP